MTPTLPQKKEPWDTSRISWGDTHARPALPAAVEAGRDRQTLNLSGFDSDALAGAAADLGMLYRQHATGGSVVPKRLNFPAEDYRALEPRLYACQTIKVGGGGAHWGCGLLPLFVFPGVHPVRSCVRRLMMVSLACLPSKVRSVQGSAPGAWRSLGWGSPWPMAVEWHDYPGRQLRLRSMMGGAGREGIRGSL